MEADEVSPVVVQGSLANQLTTFMEAKNGQIYCGGTAAFGGDDPGFVPADKLTAKCEYAVGKNLTSLASCLTKCQIKQADAALRGLPFDEEACEQGTGKPLSCRAAYDLVTAKLLGLKTPICPACLNATAQGSLADQLTNFMDANNGQIYCGGTRPLSNP